MAFVLVIAGFIGFAILDTWTEGHTTAIVAGGMVILVLVVVGGLIVFYIGMTNAQRQRTMQNMDHMGAPPPAYGPPQPPVPYGASPQDYWRVENARLLAESRRFSLEDRQQRAEHDRIDALVQQRLAQLAPPAQPDPVENFWLAHNNGLQMSQHDPYGFQGGAIADDENLPGW